MFRPSTVNTTGSDLLTHYRATASPDVFAQIMRAYGGMVFSVCVKVTQDAADAEDASQAVFLTLAVQCKTGAKINYLGPWLKKVAKRTSLDLVRSRKRRIRREKVTAEARPEFNEIEPSQRPADEEIHSIVRSELDELPAKYRMPLVLHYFGGMNHEEISREMGCTPATLGVRLHRARKMLGKRLSARNINLQTASLGIVIAASVHRVMDEQFINATTTAVATFNTGGLGGGMMTAQAVAYFPANLGQVPQLVQDVAVSMARTKSRLAPLMLAASVTMLGGAAEGVRRLPDSMKPTLEMITPTNVMKRLFQSNTPLPRFAPPSRPTLPQAAATTGSARASADRSINSSAEGRLKVLAVDFPVPVSSPRPPMFFASTIPQIPAAVAQPALLLPLMRVPASAVDGPPYRSSKQFFDDNRRATGRAGLAAVAPPGSTAGTGPTASGASGGPGDAVPAARPVGAGHDGPGGATGDTATNRASVVNLSSFAPADYGSVNISSNLNRTKQLRAYRAALVDETSLRNSVFPQRPADGLAGAQPMERGISDNGGTAGPTVPIDSANLADGTTVSAGTTAFTSAGNGGIGGGLTAEVSTEEGGGKLRNGFINVTRGNGRYYWLDPLAPTTTADSAAGKPTPTIEFDVKSATSDGTLAVRALSLDSTEAPARPTAHHFVNLWKLDSTVDFQSVGLTVRYDDELARSMGLREAILKLWVYDADKWVRINDDSFARNLKDHTLSGRWSNASFIGVSAPEPTGLLLFSVPAVLALLRRRR